MNILGIGPLELVIIVLILLLILGPDDLEKTGKTVGRWINKITKSEGWMAITTISRELRGLPARLAREAELDRLKDEFDLDKQIGATPVLREPSASKKASHPTVDETNSQKDEPKEPPTQAQTPKSEEKSE